MRGKLGDCNPSWVRALNHVSDTGVEGSSPAWLP